MATKLVSLLTGLLLALCATAHADFQLANNDKPLSLEDLGFKKADTQADLELQQTLERRTSMLHTHQVLGLITAVPMVAQLFLAQDVNHNATRRNIHMGVGIATAGLYGATASFAIFAPKPAGIEDTGATKIHRALAWVHGPLMIITPILGGLAYSQVSKGERVHGVASLHGASALVLTISYLASMAVMSFNF
jgi:hypothetical protein